MGRLFLCVIALLLTALGGPGYGQSADDGFNPARNNPIIFRVQTLSDGRLMAQGGFTQFAGVNRSRIARLHIDGSVDLSFNASTGSPGNGVLELSDGAICCSGASPQSTARTAGAWRA